MSQVRQRKRKHAGTSTRSLARDTGITPKPATRMNTPSIAHFSLGFTVLISLSPTLHTPCHIIQLYELIIFSVIVKKSLRRSRKAQVKHKSANSMLDCQRYLGLALHIERKKVCPSIGIYVEQR